MKTSSEKPRSMTRPILIGALVIGVACAGAVLLLTRGPDADRRGRQSVPPGRLHSPGKSQESARSTSIASSSSRVLPHTATGENEAAAAPVGLATVASLAEPKPYSRQLVGALCRLDQSSIAQNPEEVAEWKENLQQLIAQGPNAVAAIREFLQKNLELDFG